MTNDSRESKQPIGNFLCRNTTFVDMRTPLKSLSCVMAELLHLFDQLLLRQSKALRQTDLCAVIEAGQELPIP